MMPMEPMRPVVAGIDETDASMSALDLAAEEAAARLTPLVIVSAHPAGRSQLDMEHGLLGIAVSRVLADHPGLAAGMRLIAGEPSRVLVAQSRGALLLVVGHEDVLGSPAPPGGSVAARVVDGSACPVIVYRPVDPERETAHPRPVLVGVDGHAGSDHVVEFAFQEAALRGAPVWGVHVWPGSGADGVIAGGAIGRQQAARLHEAMDTWSAKYPEVPTRRHLMSGRDVARALTRASLDAQLVVVGSARHHDPNRPRGGETARRMIDLAGCPVAVVPLPA